MDETVSNNLSKIDEEGFIQVQSKKRFRRSSSATSAKSPTHKLSDRSAQVKIPSKTQFSSMNTDDKLNTLFDMFLDMGQLSRNIDSLTQNMYLTNARADVGEARLRLLEYKSIDTEARLLKGNLIFTGIEESANEDCFSLIKQLINKRLKINLQSSSLCKAYRLGRRTIMRSNQNRGRPILASFSNPLHADEVIMEARLLRGTQIGISRDYPREIREARKELWPEFKAAKLRYGPRNVKIRYPAALVINGDTIKDLFPNWNEILRGSRNSNVNDRVYENLSKTIRDSVNTAAPKQPPNRMQDITRQDPMEPSSGNQTDCESDTGSDMDTKEGSNDVKNQTASSKKGPGYLIDVHPPLTQTLSQTPSHNVPDDSQPPSQLASTGDT